MKVADLFEETYFSLTVNKARSFLTTLGIVIGIGSVIAMVSIGQGAQGSITASIQSIGSNLIIVTAGAQRSVGSRISEGFGSSQTLTLADEQALSQQLTQISAIDAELSRRYQITASGTNTNTQVVGTTSQYPIVRNVNMDLGDFITDQQVSDLSKVAVLGPTTRDNLFGQGADPTGQKIKINGIEFTVMGVTISKGGSGFANQDDIVFIPISVAQHFLAGSNAKGQYYVTTISISAQSSDAMTSVQNQANQIMLSQHQISDPTQADFTVQNQADIASAASSVTGTLTMLLAAIAGISLVVGGIGIMNMMLTTVTERTREIGLRKAIGAKKKDISTQFLAESVMLTFIGGIFGVILGWLAALAVTQFTGIATSISSMSVILGFGVSAAIGIVFGYYPARRAASLNPIEALRYE